jgi:hypothetical protein
VKEVRLNKGERVWGISARLQWVEHPNEPTNPFKQSVLNHVDGQYLFGNQSASTLPVLIRAGCQKPGLPR